VKSPEGGGKSTGKKMAKPKALRAASADDPYGCGVCTETFPTIAAPTAHALTRTAI
jgi:hypothetical protein